MTDTASLVERLRLAGRHCEIEPDARACAEAAAEIEALQKRVALLEPIAYAAQGVLNSMIYIHATLSREEAERDAYQNLSRKLGPWQMTQCAQATTHPRSPIP